MYGNYRNKRKPYKGKRKMSATKKAYLAGLRRGKAMARGKRFYKRW